MTRRDSFNAERSQYLNEGMFDGTCPFEGAVGGECSHYNWESCSRCSCYVDKVALTSPKNEMLNLSESDFNTAITEFLHDDGKPMCPFSVRDKECFDIGYATCNSCIHMLSDEV